VTQAEVAARIDELLIERDLIVGRDPDLVAEVAGIARADHRSRRHADRHLANVEEPERAVATCCLDQALQQLA
jgi:hypothetical protein